MDGAKNARYTSKTIQNEVLQIAADMVREDLATTVESTGHFSVLGDEVTFQGEEILSVCLNFVDMSSTSPKNKCPLLELGALERITGEGIGQNTPDTLKKYNLI